MADVVILWLSEDGEEHEERWDSPDAFLCWAAAEGVRGTYTAYEEDEDGDLLVTAKGRI
jgi:hypothetical protein